MGQQALVLMTPLWPPAQMWTTLPSKQHCQAALCNTLSVVTSMGEESQAPASPTEHHSHRHGTVQSAVPRDKPGS